MMAPHGSICVELGDTYAGSGGAGGDYNPDGLRENQPRFGGSSERAREGNAAHWRQKNAQRDAWPLSKSLCGIPTLFAWSLAYGRNLLRPERLTDPWRIRNVVAWVRPNPPVGALGDKFRPATSYMTIACKSRTRWFDLDAVREPAKHPNATHTVGNVADTRGDHGDPSKRIENHPGGTPPLDWWNIPTEPYKGSHYATWPRDLLVRPILAMCPLRVCTVCGEPSRRIVEAERLLNGESIKGTRMSGRSTNNGREVIDTADGIDHNAIEVRRTTVGWTDCGHNAWRPGVVLDPFAGTGTTLAVATGHGRDAIGIDIDERNADLALERIGPLLLTVEHHRREGAA